jgi:hypothetical protein
MTVPDMVGTAGRRYIRGRPTAGAQPMSHDVNLVPLYKLIDERYVEYWNVGRE